MGVDMERRVRDVISAQAYSSQAELIIERQSRKSVESSLYDALSELVELRSLAPLKTRNGESVKNKDQALLQDLKESLYNLTLANGKLLSKKYILEKNDEKNKSAINDLRDTFHKARVIFRSEER